jgi:hypothetical protein
MRENTISGIIFFGVTLLELEFPICAEVLFTPCTLPETSLAAAHPQPCLHVTPSHLKIEGCRGVRR